MYLLIFLSFLFISCGQDIDCNLVEKGVQNCYYNAFETLNSEQLSLIENSKKLCSSYKSLKSRSDTVLNWTNCMAQLDPRSLLNTQENITSCTQDKLNLKTKENPILFCYSILQSSM